MTSHVMIKNISELVTLSPMTKNPLKANVERSDLGIKKNAWLSMKGGKVHDFGEGEAWRPHVTDKTEVLDAKAKLVMPGLVDSHTHPLYGGDRSGEFAKRLDGKTYSEIAQAGGGIYSTVAATEKTSDEELLRLTEKRLDVFLSYGVTTVEVKSGYSVTPGEDLRQLKLLNHIKKTRQNQTLKVTALPLHVVPKNKKASDYVKECEKILTLIKEENLADFVDMFIEEGYYSKKDCEPFVMMAKELGLGVKIHADEFTRSGGAQLAAECSAVSADHLQFASQEDKKLLGQNEVVATILPGTSLYTNIPYTQAQSFIKEACRVAIASDHNPGSCQLSNLPMLVSIAALHCGLTAAQAVASVTFMGAAALGLEKVKGALAKGYDADYQILPFKSHECWLASMGSYRKDSSFS